MKELSKVFGSLSIFRQDFSGRDADPTGPNLPFIVGKRLLLVLHTPEFNDGVPSVFPILHIKSDAVVGDPDPRKEVNHVLFADSEGQPPQLHTPRLIFFVYTFAATHRVRGLLFELESVIFITVDLGKLNPPLAQTLLVAVVARALPLLPAGEEDAGLARLAALLIQLVLETALHVAVATEKLEDLLIGGLEGQSSQTQSALSLLELVLFLGQRDYRVTASSPHLNLLVV